MKKQGPPPCGIKTEGWRWGTVMGGTSESGEVEAGDSCLNNYPLDAATELRDSGFESERSCCSAKVAPRRYSMAKTA
jgi:hypothetical protein